MENVQKLKCQNYPKKNNIEITISFPEKIDKGIFTKSFTSYLVETLPFKFQVRKRFSDFEWLQNILNTQFSNYVIPSIPHKNYGDRFTEALILKRTRMLKKFLDVKIYLVEVIYAIFMIILKLMIILKTDLLILMT